MPDFTKITSESNEKIKLLSFLQSARGRKKEQKFFVEGMRAIQQALDNGIDMEFLFISMAFVEKNKKNTLFEDKSIHEKIFVVEDKIFMRFSDTVNSQGMIGIFNIKGYEDTVFQSDKTSFVLVLDAIQDPGNLGTIIRTALAYGIDMIFTLKGTVDPFSPKVCRTSMGGNLCLPIIEMDAEKCIAILKENGYTICSASLGDDSTSYRNTIFSHKTALVLGNEANGISQEILEQSDKKIIIPIFNQMESLNVAVAGGILMNAVSYEITSK